MRKLSEILTSIPEFKKSVSEPNGDQVRDLNQHRPSVIVRPPMNQDEFDQKFAYRTPSEDTEAQRKLRKLAYSYFEPFTSCKLFSSWLVSLVPILSWMPSYNWKENFFCDLIGGLTVGVMQVPQGIAYAMLARQNAVVGLYTSLFPPLIYMIFGTSRHNSIGSFAVVSLMTGIAVDRLTDVSLRNAMEEKNATLLTSADMPTPLEVASALALTVGFIQFLMGFFRLSFLTTYLSDQVVAGFTTGASLHVFVSQLKDLFGIRGLPRRKGPAYMLRHLFDLARAFPRANVVTCILSFLTITFLVLGKEVLNPRVKKYTKNVPLPLELFVVVIFTSLVAVFSLDENYAIKVINYIPTGPPDVALPKFSLIPDVTGEALGITIVTVAVHMSLAKMFAKKLEYSVDPGQELFALSFCSLGSSCLPVYPVSCSLGRTLVNVEAGTKTQFSTVYASVIVLAVALYFGSFLSTLPMCVLASCVVVALKGMARKFTDLRTLWPLSKIDFSIWVVSFLATVLIDVSEGLIISVLYALFTTVIREQWPRWHLLGNVTGTTDFRDSERYEDVCFFSGICMFRFDSPLLFTNVDRFKQTVNKAYQEWEKSQEFFVLKTERPALLMEPGTIHDRDYSGSNISEHSSNKTVSQVAMEPSAPLSRHFVIDCSGFTFVDYMGVSALKEIYCDMRNRRILVYFAAAKAPVRDLFESSGFYSFVAKENFYPTIRDAVSIARRRQMEFSHGKAETVFVAEHDRLSEIIGSQPLD